MNKKQQRSNMEYVDSIHGLGLLYKAAKPYYKTPSRLYHNSGHALMVENNVFMLQKIPAVSLVLAARWHDAIYVPGAENGLSERLSAAALTHASRSLDLTQTAKNLVVQASDLIIQTDVKTHMRRTRAYGDLAVLLDSDLSSLALDYKEFRANQLNLIIEQTARPPTTDGCESSAEFLTRLATVRKYIYHTDTGRDLFEAVAQRNIETWVDEVKNTCQVYCTIQQC